MIDNNISLLAMAFEENISAVSWLNEFHFYAGNSRSRGINQEQKKKETTSKHVLRGARNERDRAMRAR